MTLNAHAQRPEGEQREPPVRWSVMLGGATSFNNLIRPQEHRWRNRDPEHLGGLEIDDKLVFGSPLHRQVGWFDTLEDLVDVGSGAPGQVNEIRRVTHETACLHILPRPEHSRQTAEVVKSNETVDIGNL